VIRHELTGQAAMEGSPEPETLRGERSRDVGQAPVLPGEGIALLSKPEGMTSFQALSPLKRSLRTGKLGHTGTLDKFASGLLVVLVGGLTRLGPWFTSLDKVYEAKIRFGEETDTLDPEGLVVGRAEPPHIESLSRALVAFRGPLMQSPPAYSAIHIDGERASDRARRGELPDMKARPVTIHKLELLGYDGRTADIRLRCSSGTYVRSLARDLALAVGSRAHLTGLRRLAVGPFLLEAARPALDFGGAESLMPLEPDLAASLGLMPMSLEEGCLGAFENGRPIRAEDLRPLARNSPEGWAVGGHEGGAEGPSLAIFSTRGRFLGMMEEEGGRLRYRFVLPRARGEGA